MVHHLLKSKLFLVLVSIACYVSISKADDSDDDWDIQDDSLTREIEKISQRPDTYMRTKFRLDVTELTDPEEYYENEYKDMPCQDKAEGKIRAKKTKEQLIHVKKAAPKVVVDTLNVSKVNGVFKIQQDIKTNVSEEIEKDTEKKTAIGDNINEEIPKENEIEQHVPIGDNLNGIERKQEGIVAKNEPQQNMKDIVNEVKEEVLDENKKPDEKLSAIMNDLKNVPNVKTLYNVVEANEHAKDVEKAKPELKIKSNVAEHNEANTKDVEKTKPELKIKGNLEAVRKLFDEINGVNRNIQDAESQKEKIPSNDLKIKIKLERVDDAKSNLNNQMNSLVDMVRRPFSGLGTLQSMMNKMLPLSLNGLSGQNLMDSKVAQPQNFYMKYLQINPEEHKLRYEYYFFQKYVFNRYNDGKVPSSNGNQLIGNQLNGNVLSNGNQLSNGSPLDVAKSLLDGRQASSSLLMNKLISQMLNPSISLLSNPIMTLLNPPVYYRSPRQDGGNLPVRIFINEKSVAKYKRSLDGLEAAKNGRAKREAEEPTTEREYFNEGPFKVEEKQHLQWAKDFLKQMPKDDRLSSYKVIQEQPSSTDPYQWYHAFPGENLTFYTVEPTVTRILGPDEPRCKCGEH